MKKIFLLTLSLLLFLTTFSTSSYASTPYASWDTVLEDYGQFSHGGHLIFYSSAHDRYYMRVFSDINSEHENNNAFFTIKFNSSNTTPILSLMDASGKSYNFKMHNYEFVNGKWELIQQSTANRDYAVFSPLDNELVETSHTVYYNDGTVFFPEPPATLEEQMAEMVAKEMETFPPKIMGMMKIILLCGVGCLALLIVLPILLKVLRNFRVQ